MCEGQVFHVWKSSCMAAIFKFYLLNFVISQYTSADYLPNQCFQEQQ